MAGRSRSHYLRPPNAAKLREAAALSRPTRLHPEAAAARPLPPAALEERLVSQHREIQSLLSDNQRLAADHVALKQELSLAQQDLRHLSAAASKVKAEGDAEVRAVYERSLKVETELRSIDAMNQELSQLRADIQNMIAMRRELAAQLSTVEADLARARAESEQAEAAQEEIEVMQREVQKGRAAIEYEKKIRASNLEQSQVMEKNMVSMAREIEKLHAELANAEKRARAAAAAAAAANPSTGYAGNYSNPEMAHGGIAYSDPYAMYQAQKGAGSGAQYVAGAMHTGSLQQTHGHG